MDVIKRAWLYITRKKKKSIIMLFVLFAIATAILSSVSIKKAAKISSEISSSNLSNFFNVKNDVSKSLYEVITRKDIEKILTVKGIKSYNAELMGAGDAENIQKVKPTKETPYNYEGVEKSLAFLGNDNSESDLKFTSNMLKLVEGRHIVPSDKNKVLIHKDLAELNNLKIGDKITLRKIDELDYRVIKGKGKDEVSLEIIGIFERGTGDGEIEGNLLDIVENNLLCDNNSIAELYGYTDTDKTFTSATFHIDEGVNIDSVIEEVKKLPLNWDLMKVERGSDVFLALTESFRVMDNIVNMMLIGSIVIGGFILILILTFWIQGRIHETGILLSIGISKYKIIAQYIVELLMISILAFSLSYFSGQLISQNVGESIMQKSSKETVQNLKYGSGVPLGNDPNSNMLTHTSDDIEVKITPIEMMYLLVIGSGIIVLSVFISSISIIRLKPKEILSKMS